MSFPTGRLMLRIARSLIFLCLMLAMARDSSPPNLPDPLLQIPRDAFEKMLGDPGFAAEGKKLVDWDGSYLTGEQLQKRIDVTVSQPPDVIARIKQILQ